MKRPSIAILHYTAPPVVGGVEAVILAHARYSSRPGIRSPSSRAGARQRRCPRASGLVRVPEMDSQHAEMTRMSAQLEQGRFRAGFEAMSKRLMAGLWPRPDRLTLIVHNVFTKHFNLPLTAAL